MRHSDKNNGMGTTDGNGILCDMYLGVCTASWLLFVVFSAWRMGFLFYFLQWTFYGYGHSITYNNWLRTLCSCLCFFLYIFGFLHFFVFVNECIFVWYGRIREIDSISFDFNKGKVDKID